MVKHKKTIIVLALLSVVVLFFVSLFIITLSTNSNTLFVNIDSIAIVEVKGMIIDSTETIKQIHFVKDDSNIKAVVLRIDSPGGVVGPTQEIYEEIIKLRKIKPIIVSMGSVAASGGYYIAAPTTIIYANPGTITGSIGVLMKLANFQALLDKIGIKSDILKSGEFKDTGSPVRSLSVRDKQILQGIIDSMYEQFVSAVADGRKMPIQQVRKLADGRIFTGQQAKQLNLIDKLGNLQDAIDEAAKIAGIKHKPRIICPPSTNKSFIDIFMGGFSESLVARIRNQSNTEDRFEYSIKTGLD